MDLHFHRKVAYKFAGSHREWLGREANGGSRIVYVDDDSGAPPSTGVVQLYVEPAQSDRFYPRTADGGYWRKGGTLHPGWQVNGDSGAGVMPLTHTPHPSGNPQRPWIQLTAPDGYGGGRFQLDGPPRVSILWMHPDRTDPFELVVVTDTWDSPSSWMGADLSGVDFRGMGDVLPHVRDWTGANLMHASFEGLDLRNVRFNRDQWLVMVNMKRANLAGRDFGRSDLSHADLSGADLRGANFSRATMWGTTFSGADLSGAIFGAEPGFGGEGVRRTDFRGAKLDGADLGVCPYADLRATRLTMALRRPLDARHADLRGAVPVGEVLRGAQLTGALLADTDLGGIDLTGTVLDDADLTAAVLTSADLTDATLRRAALRRTSLSSAKLVRADCTQAQLGATRTVLTLSDAPAAGAASDALREAFAAEGLTLSRAAALTASEAHGGWLLADGETRYRISPAADGGGVEVHEYLSIDQAAVLTNAYMPDAIFDQAELFAVNMGGAHWYGSRARALNANLEQIDASGANLGQIELTRARLMGATLGSAILAGARLRGAQLGPSAQGEQCSLQRALLAGADLTAAVLDHAVMTDAAVAVTASAGGVEVVGVPLFALDARFAATLDRAQLDTALRNAFADSGYRLASDARATQRAPGQAWEVTQGHDDPEQTANRYATFAIVNRDGALQVHGSALWITRIGGDGKLETIRFAYAATALTAQELNAETTCPNGRKLATNQADRRPWHQMMTALSRPPTPPECIPAPDRWCSR